MRSLAVTFCLLALCLPVRAADPLVDSAVNALAQLTDPNRLALLPEADFRAQLGPALGWLNVARRRDVSPESVIVRALARNGLDGERARLTREALLRNLARADAWELFAHADSARALSVGQPAPIPAGIHQGHLAQAAVILPDGLGPRDRREFACLVLRADDENPPRPARGSHHRQPGDLLARNVALPANRRSARPVFSPPPAGVAMIRPAAGDEDSLPVSYATNGHDRGTVAVREEVTVGQPVALAALGGPALRFVLRGVDEGSVRFELGDDAATEALPRAFSMPLAQGIPAGGAARVWTIYGQPGGLRISLYDAAPGVNGDTRTVLFEFTPAK